MKITFLGTRGYIEARTRLHHNHASTLIEYQNTRIMIDRGLDWLNKPYSIMPEALFVTHAHPDHAWGLQSGVTFPVYASAQSWQLMDHFAIDAKFRHLLHMNQKIEIGPFLIEPFFVVHSIRAPANGYRITAGSKTIFYSGDIVYIPERHQALKKVDLYIGDAASIKRPLIRQKDGVLFGHAPISTQLSWCAHEGIAHAVFTHCGSQIVEADGRTINAAINELAHTYKVKTVLAHDGFQYSL